MKSSIKAILIIIFGLFIAIMLPNIIEIDSSLQTNKQVEFNLDMNLAFFCLNNNSNNPQDSYNDIDNANFKIKLIFFEKCSNQETLTNLTTDSNGNPIKNEKYNKAVYKAFSPDDNFG